MKTKIEFSDGELQLLSEALGEAVASQEKIAHDAEKEIGRNNRIVPSLWARHRELLTLMERVDSV
jgi:hypothetical protein